jgi:hypothetical protein
MQSQDRNNKLLPLQGQARKNMVLKRKLGKSPGFFLPLPEPGPSDGVVEQSWVGL